MSADTKEASFLLLPSDTQSVFRDDLYILDIDHRPSAEVGYGLTGQVAKEGCFLTKGSDVEGQRIGLKEDELRHCRCGCWVEAHQGTAAL